ncbi:MAG: hypothetical protein E6Z83_21135 [Pantoea sp.]|uniref:Uncharacterized protein n=1 Tax=Pantoea septica TaxID=472695 RepID=A0ABX3UPM7_9GAMM|nr:MULTISPECIES: hypothetical protein [Pantoea]MDU5783279.1 hypothetical protein [Pantoea sp.]ORM97602.1 hypothetical protein HA46_14685 [Pantoea septica]
MSCEHSTGVQQQPKTPDFNQVFYLSMAPESGWFIRRARQSVKENALMMGALFFQAVYMPGMTLNDAI